MPKIPADIPSRALVAGGGTTTPADQYSQYDVAIGGIGFLYANTTADPNLRETAPFEKARIDQADTPGEQTLTGWWLKSQDSFHGGAGQLQLEPAIPTPVTHVRFDASKNVDVFVPGRVARLPDTSVISSDAPNSLVALTSAGVDCVAYIVGGVVKLIRNAAATTATVTFTGVSGAQSLATDGQNLYCANATTVYALDPTNISTATSLATYTTSTNAVLGWQKSRLMLATAGAIYALDVSQSAVALSGTSPYFLYQHPSPGFQWRCFAGSPTAILAAGDTPGLSIILQITQQNVVGQPALIPNGQMAEMPVGEKILSLQNIEGTYLAIGTNKGIRIGQFDSYFSRLTWGALQLLATDPTIPCNAIIQRDRFAYAVGSAYDESGLLAVDLGTKTDEAGRYAWSGHLIAPTATTNPATAAAVLTVSNRIVFTVPGQGIVLEGVGPGSSNREAWLRTSRIRFDTTELKLFKLGRVRGTLTAGEVQVTGITPAVTQPLGTFGFVSADPDEFRLPVAQSEWLQLKLNLLGSTTILTSYGVKALPGTRRQRHIQPVLSMYDSESTRTGSRIREPEGARQRLEALEALDTAGDEILYQEFTPNGVISTLCVIESMKFEQIGRPTRTSDIGGTITVLLRSVES